MELEDTTSCPVEEINFNHAMLQPLINKVRQVVKMFRKSPTKNDDVLQRYVKADFGSEISLSLDCRTRLNSLLEMLEKFFEIRYCVKKALIDLKSDIVFSDEDFDLLDELIRSLLPIKLAVEALCRRDANLLMADATMKFMLEKLKGVGGDLSQEVYTAFVCQIIKRRTDLSS